MGLDRQQVAIQSEMNSKIRQESPKELLEFQALAERKVTKSREALEQLEKQTSVPELEHKVANRPAAEQLMQQNILKNSKLAPSLQQKEAELKQAQLRNNLDNKIGTRPSAENLKEKNILKETTVAPALHAAKSDLERSRLENHLEGKISTRPSAENLKEKNILKESTVAPALQSAKSDLERSRLEDHLGGKISTRPSAEHLMEKNILSPECKQKSESGLQKSKSQLSVHETSHEACQVHKSQNLEKERTEQMVDKVLKEHNERNAKEEQERKLKEEKQQAEQKHKEAKARKQEEEQERERKNKEIKEQKQVRSKLLRNLAISAALFVIIKGLGIYYRPKTGQ